MARVGEVSLQRNHGPTHYHEVYMGHDHVRVGHTAWTRKEIEDRPESEKWADSAVIRCRIPGCGWAPHWPRTGSTRRRRTTTRRRAR